MPARELDMRSLGTRFLLGCFVAAAWSAAAVRLGDRRPYTHRQDVVYGRKDGAALTLDVFTPKARANGAAVIHVISGGWLSTHEAIDPAFAAPFTRRGYTVFAVVHRSPPRYSILDILQDMHRAVRFIRHHARDYGIDPERIGITGGSAGGHLALMQGTAGDRGDPKARDPVERASSRVQAVACFVPPTDFLNFGEQGRDVLHFKALEDFRAAFDFHSFDPETHRLERITDHEKVRRILRQISPITHVSADDAPTLIMHGTEDHLVPIQQAEAFVARLQEVGVPARLVVKPGADHGWKGMDNDLELFADWFDRYLLRKEAHEPTGGAAGSRGCRTRARPRFPAAGTPGGAGTAGKMSCRPAPCGRTVRRAGRGCPRRRADAQKIGLALMVIRRRCSAPALERMVMSKSPGAAARTFHVTGLGRLFTAGGGTGCSAAVPPDSDSPSGSTSVSFSPCFGFVTRPITVSSLLTTRAPPTVMASWPVPLVARLPRP
jgi:acetyl esterase/lipase